MNELKQILLTNNNVFILFSGLNLITLTYPLDVIRTRMTLDKTMANYSSIYK